MPLPRARAAGWTGSGDDPSQHPPVLAMVPAAPRKRRRRVEVSGAAPARGTTGVAGDRGRERDCGGSPALRLRRSTSRRASAGLDGDERGIRSSFSLGPERERLRHFVATDNDAGGRWPRAHGAVAKRERPVSAYGTEDTTDHAREEGSSPRCAAVWHRSRQRQSYGGADVEGAYKKANRC